MAFPTLSWSDDVTNITGTTAQIQLKFGTDSPSSDVVGACVKLYHDQLPDLENYDFIFYTEGSYSEYSTPIINLTGLTANTAYTVVGFAHGTGTEDISYTDFELYLAKNFTTLLTTPTVSIDSISNYSTTGFRVNCNLTATGGATVTRRGVCYLEGTSGDPTTSNSVSYEDGSFGTGTYYRDLSGLTPGTSYRVRTYAVNSQGTGYSTTQTVITVPAAPTGVSATDGTYTNKVTITWTKSTGASGYIVYRNGSSISGTLGDVAIWDDTTADAPTITPGSAGASDGTDPNKVILSISGESANNGTSYTYTVVAVNVSGNSSESTGNTGYKGIGSLSYQWQRSAGASDADYSNITDANTESYDDTAAPLDGSIRYYKCILNATGATQQITTPDSGYIMVGGSRGLRIRGRIINGGFNFNRNNTF